MITRLIITTFITGWLSTGSMQAQVSTNPNKYLGNITTWNSVDAGDGIPQFYTLWNQITCENESKWSSVEGTRGTFSWSGADRAFNYAKQHNFTYKFHALVWGAQYPGWLTSLSATERLKAITNWFDQASAHYKTLPMIDVVNEAVGMHQQGNPMMKESLGGGGKTGYDWLIKAFEMAYERWPNAILIYNDYNSIQWDIDNYIDLVRTLRDAGAPIDAYGNQSHDVNDISVTNLKNALKKQQDALQMPMFITELDIDKADDTQQKNQYKNILPIMWEAPYCAGVTLWGYVLGKTWVDNSGLYRGGVERPAMTWIKEYMETDAAKNAVGPFPGTKKEASIYIRPASIKVAKGDSMSVMVRAKMATKTIEKVELYVGSKLAATMTEAPYLAKVASTTIGWNTLKAIVTTTDGTTYERRGRINVLSSTTKRTPYSETIPQLPGTINITQYDKGASGVSYNNASRSTEITKDDQWMEYTVDVAEDGVYAFDAEVASNKSTGSFHLAEYTFDNINVLSEFVSVPKTGGTNVYKTLHGLLQVPLTAGRHVLTLLVDKGGFYIKNIKFSRYEENKTIISIISNIKPSTTINVGDTAVITVTSRSNSSATTVDHVDVYANNLLIGTLNKAPYKFEFVPNEKGAYSIVAIATGTDGKCRTSAAKAMTVNGKRIPYKTVSLPGTIEAEDFDMGGESLSFKDSDADDQGGAGYRTDNEGVDIVKSGNRYVLGYTVADEWTEYTVNVTQAGKYSYEATVSSGTTGSGFTIGLKNGSSITSLAKVNVPKTADNSWDTYTTVKGNLSTALKEGQQILRFTINGANCNIDKVKFECTEPADGIMTQTAAPTNATVYNLYGVPVGTTAGWQSLPQGLYIVNGRKVKK